MRKAQIFGVELRRNRSEGKIAATILYGEPENPFDSSRPRRKEAKVETNQLMNFLTRFSATMAESLVGEEIKDMTVFWPLSRFSDTRSPSEIIFCASGKFSNKFETWRENFLK